jgi:hypothetical protein
MHSTIRRKLILLASATMASPAMVITCRGPVQERISSRPGRGGPDRAVGDDPLLQDAIEWIIELRAHGHTVLPYPISRLQRWSRLGYSRACALVAELEQCSEWRIAFDRDGARHAHLYLRDHAWA